MAWCVGRMPGDTGGSGRPADWQKLSDRGASILLSRTGEAADCREKSSATIPADCMVYQQKVALLKAATVLQCFATRAMYQWKSFSGSVTIIFWGLPLETTHRWAEPNGSTFSMPEAIQGDYLAKEGIPAHCTVWQENGKLVGIYGETEVEFRYCGKTVFVAYSRKDPAKRCSTMEFYIRNGQAWAVRCYTRIYQRIDGVAQSSYLRKADS